MKQKGVNRKTRGFPSFTLLELLIVLAILSILFFIVAPRFISVSNPAKTKNFLLRLQNSLIYLSDKAILEKTVYFFNFDMDERRYFFTVSEEGNPEGIVRDRYLASASIPQRLSVRSVRMIPGDEVREGKVMLPFTPTGMLLSFEIYFESAQEELFIVRGNNLSNRIRVLQKIGDEERLIH
jgi:prepilin-type N-terminal cleavage/methylation domain-containing protein